MHSIVSNQTQVTHHVIFPSLGMNNGIVQQNNEVTDTTQVQLTPTPTISASNWVQQDMTTACNSQLEKTPLPNIALSHPTTTTVKRCSNDFSVVTPTTSSSPDISEWNCAQQSGSTTAPEAPKVSQITSSIGSTVFRLPELSCNSVPRQVSTGESDTNSTEKAAKSSLNTSYVQKSTGPMRLNKFVRRLHDMLIAEQDLGVVEWRKGLLVLHSTDTFAKKVLPKYFNTKNFKTFRRQLNYYGFVHVRSFSATGTTTTALWVNQDLAKRGTGDISSVLMLKRVEPCESAKTAEGRRVRKEEAVNTVEDIGISTRAIQLEQIRKLAIHRPEDETNKIISNNFPIAPTQPTTTTTTTTSTALPSIPSIVHCNHSVNSSPLTTPSPQLPSLPDTTSTHPEGEAKAPAQLEPCAKSSTDDAANLLLMLSKSVVSS